MSTADSSGTVAILDLAILKPYFSISILECVADDYGMAFNALVAFIRKEARSRGQAIAAKLTSEIEVDGRSGGEINDLGALERFGFDFLYAATRWKQATPAWAIKESGVSDSTNEMTIALRRGRLIAVRTMYISSEALLRWVRSRADLFRPIDPDVLSGTFDGNGKMLWLQGVHRQRVTKANSKSLSGTRLQEAVDSLDDASYAMSAMTVDYVPTEADMSLRGHLTVSPEKSKLSYKAMIGLREFLIATDEALGMIEKTIASEEEPTALYPQLARRERSLANVRGAFDIRIATPEEVAATPDLDETDVERAEALRGSILDVVGDSRSPAARLTMARDLSRVGVLKVQPIESGAGFALDVRIVGDSVTDPPALTSIRDILGNGDLISIYYESGHTYNDGRLSRQNMTGPPFANVNFADFSNFSITHEKPRGSRGEQVIHDGVGKNGDNSLFAWVVCQYNTGWLICDDGPGEVADFLHLDNSGTLTVVHVKAAHSSSPNRRVAVTAFEELVSQAEKGVKLLHSSSLHSLLASPRIDRPAAWTDGRRVEGPNPRSEFLERLSGRILSDRTYVRLVQPHLLESSYLFGRTANALEPTASSRSLGLLDNLLQSTRRTVTAFWDDLYLTGFADGG